MGRLGKSFDCSDLSCRADTGDDVREETGVRFGDMRVGDSGRSRLSKNSETILDDLSWGIIRRSRARPGDGAHGRDGVLIAGTVPGAE